MPEGWFRMSGRQSGKRTVAEQMQGLAPLTTGIAGKTVLDLGCAEGLIAVEMVKAGAGLVHGAEINKDFLPVAVAAVKGLPIKIYRCDLNSALPAWLLPQYDVVLMLAILHKVHQPEQVLRDYAARAAERIAIRLPAGSTGNIISKFGRVKPSCYVNAVLPQLGWTLATLQEGPRSELVQHWVRA